MGPCTSCEKTIDAKVIPKKASPRASPRSPKSPRIADLKKASVPHHELADDQILLVRFRQVMKKSFKNPKIAFDMLDRNGDNEVSKEEWMSTLTIIGKGVNWPPETMEMMELWGAQFFDGLDANGNGLLTFTEFKTSLAKKLDPTQGLANLAVFKSAMKKSFENPRDAFDILDKNGDGTVSKDEWMSALGRIGKDKGWDEKTTLIMDDFGDAFFDQMDTNLNGDLSFKEFKENLKKSLD